MPKRCGQAQDSQSKRSRPATKKHLYLVVDDWEKGYSIRKIDPDTLLSDSDESARTDQHLHEPAALRLIDPFDAHFVAMGSNIVVLSSTRCSGEAPRTLVYDTEAAALAVGPHVPGHLAGLTVAVEDGHTVYALTTLGEDMPLSLEALSWAPCTRDAEEPGLPTHEWSWKSVAAPPPPFGKAAAIVAYAVHPDGRTVFVSTRDAGGGGGEGTYSFDGKRGEWRWHGAWVLPFRGQGYFDVDLDAWVGLHEEPGYVCCCQVASRSGTSAAPPDSDKVEEKLFCKGGEGAHLGATLTYVGDSRFCLVDSVVRGDVESACDGCLVRVTMFGLKFNRMGKLRTTSHRTTNSYAVPRYGTTFSPLAFCM